MIAKAETLLTYTTVIFPLNTYFNVYYDGQLKFTARLAICGSYLIIFFFYR